MLDDVEFTDLERRLIECLVTAPEKRVSRTERYKAVRDIEFDPGTNRLDVLVFRLRKKIVGTPYRMKTEYRFGYRLVTGKERFSKSVIPLDTKQQNVTPHHAVLLSGIHLLWSRSMTIDVLPLNCATIYTASDTSARPGTCFAVLRFVSLNAVFFSGNFATVKRLNSHMNIETRETQNIPLSLLVFSNSNMRSAKKIDDEFVNSIKYNGIVQALVVTKIGEKYEVVGGRRRLLALNALVKTNAIDHTYSVPCTLCSEEAAARLSIIENLHRSTPHPTEYYNSINRLKGEGGSRESICDYLQLSTLQYDQIIRLANLHPRIFKAYEKDELDEMQIKAFGATDDINKQIEIWKQSDYATHIPAWKIRSAMQTGLTNNDRLVKYVGMDRYTNAGGSSTPDLFTDIILIHDAHLVMDLATHQLDAALEQCRSDEPGWKWYKSSLPDQEDTMIEMKGRFYGKTRKTTDEQKSRIKVIDDELKSLIAIDEEDWTKEQTARYDELDEQHDDLLMAIQQENEYFLKKEMANSGVQLSINTSGALYYTRGIQTSDDIAGMKNKTNKSDGTGAIDADGDEGEDDTDKDYSQALMSDVGLYLRAMTKAQLVKYPDIAIELLHYSLVVDCFDSWPPMMHSVRTQHTPVETTRNDHEQSVMFRLLTDARNKLDLDWLDLEVQKERIDAYISLPAQSKKALLAFVSACAFENDLDDYIRTETALDVTEYWSPTRENYFSRIARPLLLTQVIQIVGDKAAAPYVKSTKKGLVDYISGLFDEKPKELKAVLEKWVPPLFK